MIFQFRTNRIKKYKLVYPDLTSKAEKPKLDTTANHSASLRGIDPNDPFSEIKRQLENTNVSHYLASNSVASSIADSKDLRKKTVSTAVAPVTMFQRMKGFSNADLIEEVRRASTLRLSPSLTLPIPALIDSLEYEDAE
jgi:hypothetical protein